MLLMIHPVTAAVISFKAGEGALAVHAYRDGFRGLSAETNAKLAALAAA